MLRLRTAFGLLDPGICAAESNFWGLGYRLLQAYAGHTEMWALGFRVYRSLSKEQVVAVGAVLAVFWL